MASIQQVALTITPVPNSTNVSVSVGYVVSASNHDLASEQRWQPRQWAWKASYRSAEIRHIGRGGHRVVLRARTVRCRKTRGRRGLEEMSENCQGAKFEILLDGKPQSCRNTMLTAMGAAKLIQLQHPVAGLQ